VGLAAVERQHKTGKQGRKRRFGRIIGEAEEDDRISLGIIIAEGNKDPLTAIRN